MLQLSIHDLRKDTNFSKKKYPLERCIAPALDIGRLWDFYRYLEDFPGVTAEANIKHDSVKLRLMIFRSPRRKVDGIHH